MNTNLSSGKISKILLILAIAIVVVIIVVFAVIKVVGNKKTETAKTEAQKTEKVEAPKPVYDIEMQNIKFTFQEAENLGTILKAKTIYDQDLKTTEKFIKVMVGGQNKGKTNAIQYAWDIGNIVDSEGRIFIPYDKAYFFLPKPDLCGSILKPEFQATPCVRIYEVSKLSKNLKIEVKVNDPKSQSGFLDITFN